MQPMTPRERASRIGLAVGLSISLVALVPLGALVAVALVVRHVGGVAVRELGYAIRGREDAS